MIMIRDETRHEYTANGELFQTSISRKYIQDNGHFWDIVRLYEPEILPDIYYPGSVGSSEDFFISVRKNEKQVAAYTARETWGLTDEELITLNQ